MSVAGLLTNQVSAGRGASRGPTAGLTETVPAVFGFTWKTMTTTAALQYQGFPLNERNDLIKKRFGQDIYDITKMREKYPNPSMEGRALMAKDANDAIDEWITQGRTSSPDKFNDIKTTAEIREEARKSADISEQHMNEIMLRNPSGLSRLMGGVIGGGVATILDFPNLATLPLGAGEIQSGLKGFAAARAILKAAAIDGVINAGVEVASQPAIMEWQKELGRRYGFGDAAENVAMAFVGGTALSGLIRGAGRGLNYAGSVSADMLDRIASSEKLPASVRDAAAFMSRQAHIDESAPPGMIKTGEDLVAWRNENQRLADSYENYAAFGSAETGSEGSFSISASDKGSAPSSKGAEAGTAAASQVSPESLKPFPSFETAKVEPSSLKANKIGVIDQSSNAMIYHSIKKVDNLIKKAEALLPEVNALTKAIADEIQGLEQYPGRVKTRKSLTDKIRKKGRGAETMPDILGGRIVADNPRAMEAAVEKLKSIANIIEIDNKMGKSADSYRGIHVIAMTDKGMSAEIQIQPREIRDVQDIAHEKFYKKWDEFGGDTENIKAAGRWDEFLSDMLEQKKLFAGANAAWEFRTKAAADKMTDVSSPEKIDVINMPEGLSPEVSADRVAIAEGDLKALTDELGDNVIALDDGRQISVREFADEIQGKKNLIEAMKSCRIA